MEKIFLLLIQNKEKGDIYMKYKCEIINIDEDEVTIRIRDVCITGFVNCGVEKKIGQEAIVEILLKAVGSHTKTDKQVVMCACSYRQMHMVQRAVKEVDSSAFLVMMEANQVRGEGFRPHE